MIAYIDTSWLLSYLNEGDENPTSMAMTGSKLPETRPLDGKNIWPALRDNQKSPVESSYWAWTTRSFRSVTQQITCGFTSALAPACNHAWAVVGLETLKLRTQ